MNWKVDIVRTWKRDGAINVMDIADAIANLQSNCAEVQGMKATAIGWRLISGERFETPHAIFSKKRGSDHATK